MLGPFSLGLEKFRVLPGLALTAAGHPRGPIDHAEHQSGRTQSLKKLILAFPAQWFLVNLQTTATNRSHPISFIFFGPGIFSHESLRYYLGASRWRGRGFFEKLRPGACFRKLGRAGTNGGGARKIDDARFSRGKNEIRRDPDPSDLALTARWRSSDKTACIPYRTSPTTIPHFAGPLVR